MALQPMSFQEWLAENQDVLDEVAVMDCARCGNTGRVDCEECEGDGQGRCPECGQPIELDDCDACLGKGEVDCPECGGPGVEARAFTVYQEQRAREALRVQRLSAGAVA